MLDFMIDWSDWIRAFHIISVIAWMAGLFYLPRLFVYHAEQVGQDGETHNMFLTMERRLLKAIMNPAMMATWVFGLLLVGTPGLVDWSSIWPWTKSASVLAMTWFHIWCSQQRKLFVSAKNQNTGRYFRIMNEVPTVLLVVIVFSVVLKF